VGTGGEYSSHKEAEPRTHGVISARGGKKYKFDQLWCKRTLAVFI